MPATHSDALALLRGLGLPVIESRTVSASQVPDTLTEWNAQRSQLPYETDGLVIKVNDRALFKTLGATAHHPRGAIARKYKDAPVVTQLRRVDWSRGASGKLTPVAQFDPVELHGATLRHASLHSLDHLRALDIRIGDWIQVIRAGGSVPEIIGVCTDRRTGTERPIPSPNRIP
jgi:DNA ligase (NAD+)